MSGIHFSMFWVRHQGSFGDTAGNHFLYVESCAIGFGQLHA